MSTIFGIWNRNGKPISEELEEMYKGIQHFPHERYDFIVKHNFAIGHMLTYNTHEAVHEKMPQNIKKHHLIFAAEGRIDNREELFRKIDSFNRNESEIPDGDIILQAYLKWGKQCVDHLLGKWSLVAFHTDSEELFIARDKWDYTAINYYVDDNVLAFAPSNKALLHLPFIDGGINEFMMARFLVLWSGDFENTYHKGIKRLLPSHYMCSSPKGHSVIKYWDYRNSKVLDGLTQEEYGEAMLEIMNKSVEARLRSYKPVSATLSGGLDSSTVCALAAEQLAKQNKVLKTYSHIPLFKPSESLKNYRFGDERPYINAILEVYNNIESEFLTSQNISPLAGVKKSIDLYGEPIIGAGNLYWMIELFTTAVEDNYGTILLGEFGNANISWLGEVDELPFGHLRKRYGIKKAVRLKMFSIVFKKNAFGLKMLQFFKPINQEWRKYSFINKAFEDSSKIVEKMKRAHQTPGAEKYYVTPKDQMFEIYDKELHRLHLGAHLGNELGIELRDPTNDVRVIDYAALIPNYIFASPLKRQLVRTMMKGKIPNIVLQNRKFGTQSSDLPERTNLDSEAVNIDIKQISILGFDRYISLDRIQNEWKEIQNNYSNYSIIKNLIFLSIFSLFEFWRQSKVE